MGRDMLKGIEMKHKFYQIQNLATSKEGSEQLIKNIFTIFKIWRHKPLLKKITFDTVLKIHYSPLTNSNGFW